MCDSCEFAIYGYLDKKELGTVHFHELRDGEEKHYHKGGDVDHQHGDHFGGRYLGMRPRHLRDKKVPIPPRPDLK